MAGLLHQSTHHTASPVQQKTLHQALLWIQNNPPLFQQRANPLCLDHPLPANIQPPDTDDSSLARLVGQIRAKNNPLLGIFYETLWQFLLGQLEQTRVLAANLQVNDDQQVTVGEYDLVYQYHGQIIHRELAVKFYLGVPDGNSNRWCYWVGPGLRDRLDWKMNRLLHHQATLSDTVAGRETLQTQGIEWPVNKEVLIQGRLFYPLINDDKRFSLNRFSLGNTGQSGVADLLPPPAYCNPNHWRGFWLTTSQLAASTRNTTLSYQMPGKFQWLNDRPDSPFFNREQLLQRPTGRPVYIRALDQSGKQLHLFVVPDDWPGKALQVARQTG